MQTTLHSIFIIFINLLYIFIDYINSLNFIVLLNCNYNYYLVAYVHVTSFRYNLKSKLQPRVIDTKGNKLGNLRSRYNYFHNTEVLLTGWINSITKGPGSRHYFLVYLLKLTALPVY